MYNEIVQSNQQKELLKKSALTLLIPLLYFVNLAVLYFLPHTMVLSYPVLVVGLACALIGVLFWLVSYINLGKSFGVLPQSQKRVTSGLYKIMKHPMYIGIGFTFLGLGLAKQSWQSLAYTTLILIPILVIRAYFEDKALRS